VNPEHDDRVPTADLIYAWLLRIYPRRFRERFEPAMRQVFVMDYEAASARGRRAALWFWIVTLAQVCWYGAAEQLSRANRWPTDSSVRRTTMRSALTLDCRDAYRSLRATPVVTIVALMSLALGIGANTALFSILNSLALKSLPVHEPERLALLEGGSWTNPVWEQIRDRQDQLFDGAFTWSSERFNLSDHGETVFANGAYASGRMFDVLGVRAYRGRMFGEPDDRRDGGPSGPVAVISDSLWHQRFGGRDDAVGRPISIEGVSFTIVGITPPGFFGPDVGRTCDVYVPLQTEALIRGKETFLDGRTTWWLNIMVREKGGQSLDQANAALRGVQPQIRDATRPEMPYPHYLTDPLTLSAGAGGQSMLRARYLAPLTILLAVAGAVLLIACANIANLLLARATARRHELVVRLALGASRARLARQLLIESLMLAGGGAMLGLGVAQVGSALLVRQLSTATNRVFLDTSPDWRILAFTVGMALVTSLVFGLAPALGVTRVTLNEALKAHSRSVAGDRRLGLRNLLVVGQIALSLVLIVAAGLFVRTFTSLTALPLGFNPEPLLVVSLNVQQSESRPDQRLPVFERLRDAAAAVPGAKSAALAMIRPLSGSGWNSVVVVAGSALTNRQRMTWVNGVSPGWFATSGMRLVAGRDFGAIDRPGGQAVTIVNQTFVRKYLGGGNALGRDVTRDNPAGRDQPTFRVVGVVADAVYRNPREGEAPTMFHPLSQLGRLSPSLNLVVEARPGPRGSLERSIAEALSHADGRVAFTFAWYSDLVGAPVAQERLIAMLSGFFGALALLLAGLGLYGLTSYSVNRRRREIGVRMALGANPGRVVRLVLWRVGGLVIAGVTVGAGLASWASRYVAGRLLFGLQPRDPSTFVAAAVVLVTIGALAGWLPAHRASRIDPTRVLREE
jgi:putative ABC transport system permease protein